ncbi:HET-domain-containing protein [Stipitochalara longipes BDJ]|nr:HET-domain-containing protein [Stipitochalara longipes BDJ]
MDTLPPGHIRLLHIEAGSDEAPIAVRLVTTELDLAPSYEGLSYTWGVVEFTARVACDGSALPVTQNLYDALRYLRRPDEDRIMWIDAICINQKDDLERSLQVGIMKEIYKKAIHVVIWLGKETAEDADAFTLLSRFDHLFKEKGLIDVGNVENFLYGLELPAEESQEWTALVKLFQRPWFQRIWVLQEAVMAREMTVVCGSHLVRWDLIYRLALSVQSSGMLGTYQVDPHAPGISCAVVVGKLKIAHELAHTEEWTLLELLRLTRKYNATDARDKVFALHGVVTNPYSIGAAVDYSKPLEEVYTDVAVHELIQKKTLFSLANAGISTYPRNPNLPSWVADWSHDNERRSIIAAGAKFNADRCHRPILSISKDRRTLTIRGFIFDSISELNRVYATREQIDMDPRSGEAQKKKIIEGKRSIENCIELAKGARQVPEGQTSEEVLWRTLCCDLTPDIPPSRAPQSYGGGYKLLRKFHKATREDGSYDFTHEVYKKPEFLKNNWIPSSVFVNSVQKFTIARNMCVTAGGYLGRVPRGSEIGDKTCILFGGCVPFVLRDTRDGYFTFIGECYIHGIMDGEAIESAEIEDRYRDFDIR